MRDVRLGQRMKPTAPSRLAMIAYLVIIVVPTLVLLALGVQSVRGKHQAIEALTEKNERLSIEHLADAFERRLRKLGEAALQDPALADVMPLVSRPPSPENQRALRGLMSGLAERHPIADRLILQQDRTVRFPVTRWPLGPETLAGVTAGADATARAQFEAALAAEERAFGAPDFERAAAAYRDCERLPLPRRVKAIALAHAARCHRAAGDPASAASAWRQLAARYGDECDVFHRPYGLVAGLELMELPALLSGASRPEPTALLRDLAGGRWEVSQEQARYFVDRLREIETPGLAAHRLPASPFLAHLDLAAAVERRLTLDWRQAGTVKEASLVVNEETDVPVMYASFGSNAENSRVAAVVVLEKERAQTILSEFGGDGAAEYAPVIVSARAVARDGKTGPSTSVVLRGGFSGWALVASRGRGVAAEGRRDLFVFGGTTALVLAVLLLGIALVVRDAARQRGAARLRADFVSGVSHQLRTPLALIRLYSEMLTDYPDISEQERRERLDVITSESGRLTTLIDRVLDFSRIERGLKPYSLEPGDLGATVRSVAGTYADYLRRRGFTVDIAIPDGLPQVRFDRNAVADALVNLVDNAAKYAADGKYVLVRVAASGTDAVALEVADRGPGIPDADRERMFQPFQRGSQRQEKGGYGLGLFLVRNLMEAHGGRVELESGPAQGSVFRLVFPVDGVQSCRRS